jgi:hypothetical protein
VKRCPSCGYKSTTTNHEFLRQVKLHFGDLPVWEMMKRRWICQTTSIEELGDELMMFFGVDTPEKLHAVLAGKAGLPGIVRLAAGPCNLEPVPRYKYKLNE